MIIPYSVKGKVALITGGVGGIGFSYAKHLMSNGIKGIILADREHKMAQGVIREIEKFGKGDVYYIQTNVKIEEQLKDAFDEAIRRFNQLDIFINHAGILHERTWKKMIKTNFTASIKGIFMAMKEYLPKYKSSDDCVIVHTSCITALQPLQSLAVYSTTKCGILGLHKALSAEYWYKTYGCRFLAICPGLTDTHQFKHMKTKGIDLDLFDEECCEWNKQDPDHCGVCLMKALKEGQNGSIWICENGKIYEWKIPDRFEVREKIMKNPLQKCPQK